MRLLGPITHLLVVLMLTATATTGAAAEPALHVRRGLPNLKARAAAGEELCVAYLGGSITAAEGWRPLFTAHLRAQFPKLNVTEIAAGLPGTGSDLGVCRLGPDVLRHRPDLVFVEFAVNDASTPPEQIERSIEGIVRQVWRTHPEADLCFVYTLSTPGLPDLVAGNFPPAARAMERIADRYGIPSLHFGVEIARRVADGSLSFHAPADDGRTFSLDGVHPTATGHRIYFTALEQALPGLLANATARPAEFPPPLQPDNWEGAALREINETMRRGDWAPVTSDDANLRGATKSLLPPTWRTAQPGAAIEFEFTGHTVGLLGIAAPDSGEFHITVDDRPPVIATFFDSYVSPTFCRQRPWFYPERLPAGTHRVRVELLGTMLPKADIKAKAGRPMADPQPYAAHRLTLCGVLTVTASSP
jgi:lysophospholipase L1-like esterase